MKPNTTIPVNDTYQIELDKYGWQISKFRKRGEDGRYEGYRWYRTLSDACVGLAQFIIYETECHGAVEVKEALCQFEDKITKEIQKAGIGNTWVEAHANQQ